MRVLVEPAIFSYGLCGMTRYYASVCQGLEAQGVSIDVPLAALSPLGFLAAFATRQLFGGALADPGGIPPDRIKLLGSVRVVDLNLVAGLAALLSLFAMVWIYRW